jgi:hypothetical protein
MLAAGAQPQTEFCFIQYYRCRDKDRKSYIGSDIAVLKEEISDYRYTAQNRNAFDAERIFEQNLLNVVILDHARCKNSERGRKHIKRGAAYGLVGFHINGGIRVKQGENHSGKRGYQNGEQQQQLAAKHILHLIYEEYAGKSAHYHNAFERDIHNAASLRIHSAERNDQERDREKPGLLYQEDDNIHLFALLYGRAGV